MTCQLVCHKSDPATLSLHEHHAGGIRGTAHQDGSGTRNQRHTGRRSQTGEEARTQVLDLTPSGAEVYNSPSRTLELIGLAEDIVKQNLGF